MKFLLSAAALLLASHQVANAAVMTFDDVTGDFAHFTQSLGDIAGLDVSNTNREDFGNTASSGELIHWTENYLGLVDVAIPWANGLVGELGFTPDIGLSVTIASFWYGNYYGGTTPRNATFNIYDADWNKIWSQAVTNFTGTAQLVDVNVTIAGPAYFQFGTDWDIGIDNFTYSVQSTTTEPPTPSTVPLPASLPLLASALGLAVFLRRRRASRAGAAG